MSWRCALLSVLAALVVFLPLLAVSLWWTSSVHSSTSEKGSVEEDLTTPSTTAVTELALKFRVVGEMGDRRLARDLQHAVDRVVRLSPLPLAGYNGTTVAALRPARPRGVWAEVRLWLAAPPHRLAAVFLQAVQQGILPASSLLVDPESISCSEVTMGQPAPSALEAQEDETSPPTAASSAAEWSEWSDWTSCTSGNGRCNPAQTRTRFCQDARDGGRLMGNRDCLGEDMEVRECRCLDCSRCAHDEICLQALDEAAPSCKPRRDSNDPCGGWCGPVLDLCQRDGHSFRCLDDSECLDTEWRCANAMCVPLEKRCDGHFNCYDRSDEYGCECAEGETHCGNATSCIPPNLRCNGTPDCWDGTDEADCHPAACGKLEFECLEDPQCIPGWQHCNGSPDCRDGTDELHCLPTVFSPSDARPA